MTSELTKVVPRCLFRTFRASRSLDAFLEIGSKTDDTSREEDLVSSIMTKKNIRCASIGDPILDVAVSTGAELLSRACYIHLVVIFPQS